MAVKLGNNMFMAMCYMAITLGNNMFMALCYMAVTLDIICWQCLNNNYIK